MKNLAKIAALVSALSLLAIVPASALVISTSVGGSAQAGTVSAVSGSADTGIDVTVGVSGTSSSQTQMSSSSDETNASASAGLAVPLVVTRADIDSNTVAASNVSADNVKSNDDLSSYIAAQMQNDTSISAVDTASDHVALTYQEPAKLFGFIPVTIAATATVDQSGTVTISYPWWSYLATTDTADVQTNVQSSVNSTLGANSSANAQVNGFSAAQQAELVASIQAAMAAAANANASTSANTNVNSNAATGASGGVTP